jgi:hypothetical protein
LECCLCGVRGQQTMQTYNPRCPKTKTYRLRTRLAAFTITLHAPVAVPAVIGLSGSSLGVILNLWVAHQPKQVNASTPQVAHAYPRQKYAPWPRSAIEFLPTEDSTRILRLQIRVTHGEVPPATRKTTKNTQDNPSAPPPKHPPHQNHAPRHFIPNREYIPLRMEMFLKTNAPEVTDGHDPHVERE